MWLIVVDTYSKWPEVIQMRTVTAQRTIQELRLIFARFGLPEQIIPDNRPQFISDEFKLFVKSNGINHNRVAPYHPCSNGAAKRFLQTFKMAMKKMGEERGDLNKKLANFLTMNRKMPQATMHQQNTINVANEKKS